MSRSNYSDDCGPEVNLWYGAVASSIRGQRGQVALREMLAALDAMPVKVLAADSLVTEQGEYCALGVLGAARGVPLADIDPDWPEQVAKAFDIAPALAREIVYMNDEGSWHSETPEQRWKRMRAWVARLVKSPDADA